MTAKGGTKEAFDLKIVYLYRLNSDTSLGAEPIAYLETVAGVLPRPGNISYRKIFFATGPATC